jgi:hypothetical protein
MIYFIFKHYLIEYEEMFVVGVNFLWAKKLPVKGSGI